VAARAFGFLERKSKIEDIVRQRGQDLLATTPGSPQELDVFKAAVTSSQLITTLAPNLLGPGITSDEISQNMVRLSGLDQNTATHRAGAFVAWRRQILKPQQLSRGAGVPAPATVPAREPNASETPRNTSEQGSDDSERHSHDQEVG